MAADAACFVYIMFLVDLQFVGSLNFIGKRCFLSVDVVKIEDYIYYSVLISV